jgi:hypothetical protein
MCELLLIRHAESEFNAKETKDLDSALTRNGRRQAIEVSAFLKRKFDDIKNWRGFVSPLLRTLQTAKIIHEHTDIRFDVDFRLIEYNNATPGQLVADEQYSYSDGTAIQNFDGGYQGVISYRTALAGSRNIPALKVFQSVKKSNIIQFATNLGLSPEISGNSLHEAHAIGGYNGESPLTVAAAYASFGNGGTYNKPYSYTKLTYRDSGE